MCQTHYRQRLDLTDEGLAAAREASQRLGDFTTRLRKTEPVGPVSDWGSVLRASITSALDDDLNAPRALAAIFDAVRSGNRTLDAGEAPSPDALAAWEWAMNLLDLLPGEESALTVSADATGSGTGGAEGSRAWAAGLAESRAAAKARRDYKEADRIRDELKAAGWEIRDNKDGSIEVRKLG
jgi:cysteinyl-tRNA synthetase